MTNDANRKDPELGDALRALSRDDARLAVSPEVAKCLLAEVRAISRARRRRAWFGWSSVAAALVLGIALYAGRTGNRQPSETALSPTASESIAEIATEFLPLPYSHVPMNTGSTVRIEVPAEALVAYGLAPADFSERDGTIQADVLIGEDGLARAVRFVRAVGN
jgi:hypothetical protein